MQNSLIAVQSAVEPKDAAVVVRMPVKKTLYNFATHFADRSRFLSFLYATFGAQSAVLWELLCVGRC